MSGTPEFWIQPGFLGVSERHYPEKKILGAGSLEAFNLVLDLHPEITRFSISSFDPDNDYYVDETQSGSVRWLAKSFAPKLKEISDLFYIGLRQIIEISHTEAIVCNKILAVNSQVQCSGEINHIPMLDFVIPPSPEAEKEIINRLTTRTEGVLINSGRSYHFLGFNPLNLTEWSGFMHQALSLFPEEDFLDLEYISQSLSRGFSALRLFGYPGTDKPIEPKVIAVI